MGTILLARSWRNASFASTTFCRSDYNKHFLHAFHDFIKWKRPPLHQKGISHIAVSLCEVTSYPAGCRPRVSCWNHLKVVLICCILTQETAHEMAVLETFCSRRVRADFLRQINVLSLSLRYVRCVWISGPLLKFCLIVLQREEMIG